MTGADPGAQLLYLLLFGLIGGALVAPFLLLGTHRRDVELMLYGVEESEEIRRPPKPANPVPARPRQPEAEALMLKADALRILGRGLLSSLKLRKGPRDGDPTGHS